MPTTPKFALPYPVSSDTADVPRDVKALADRLELIVPTSPTVTAAPLPAPAFDGQILDYQLPAPANYGGQIIWRFRGRPGSTNANKWEFIGGAPLYDYNNNVVVNVNELVKVPKLTLPLAGDYSFRWGGLFTTGPAGEAWRARLVRAGGFTGVGLGQAQLAGGAALTATVMHEFRVDNVINAADAFALAYDTSAPSGGGQISLAWLSAIPVRVR